jgi:hypothetical protein
MPFFEEESGIALHTLFTKIETLKQFAIRDLLQPDIYRQYERTLQEAYDALTTVEDALTSPGMKREYQHYRLGGAMDELKPLLIQPRSKADTVMEGVRKRFP